MRRSVLTNTHAVLLIVFCMMLVSVIPGFCRSKEKKPTEKTEKLLTTEQHRLNLESFEYIWTTVRDKHYDPTIGGLNWQAVHDELRPKIEKTRRMSDARAVMRDMLSRLKLSHFLLISSEVYKNMEISQDEGDDASTPRKKKRGNAGIDVRVVDGHALVISVNENSPAEQAGIKPGWEITRIGEKEVADILTSINKEFSGSSDQRFMLTASVKNRLTGKNGDSLSILFLDGNNQETEREIILEEPKGKPYAFGNMPPLYVWMSVDTIDSGENSAGDIGYIAFNAFFDINRLMPVYNKAMKSFMDKRGIIIDLRGNPGGLPYMAMGMAGWLIGEKNRYLGTMITRYNKLKLTVLPRPDVYNGPVALLVDELTASTSEFFAAGLKDLGRVRIFGSTTAGSALPTVIEKLPNNDGFQYVVANYFSVGGKVLDGMGVNPHVEILYDRQALLRGQDMAKETAVKWIRGTQGSDGGLHFPFTNVQHKSRQRRGKIYANETFLKGIEE